MQRRAHEHQIQILQRYLMEKAAAARTTFRPRSTGPVNSAAVDAAPTSQNRSRGRVRALPSGSHPLTRLRYAPVWLDPTKCQAPDTATRITFATASAN